MFPAQPGAGFRLCFIEGGPLVGRAYSEQDVRRLAAEHGIRTTNWMTGGPASFPGGPNVDEEIAELRRELRRSDERLSSLDRGNPDLLDELEYNRSICQQMLRRTCYLAGIAFES